MQRNPDSLQRITHIHHTIQPAHRRTKESEIDNLEREKSTGEDLEVGMSTKGFNRTIINIFKDLKEAADIWGNILAETWEIFFQMGFIEQVSTTSEMKISPYEVNKRFLKCKEKLNQTWKINKNYLNWETKINKLGGKMNRVLVFHAAKSLQSCPTLCSPIDGSPPGSAVPGILQARTLEWVAISFSNAWKWKVKVKSLSHVRLLATPWTAAHQAPLSMGFSRQEHWSGLPDDTNGASNGAWVAQKEQRDNRVEKPCRETRAKISQVWQKTQSRGSKKLNKPQVG